MIHAALQLISLASQVAAPGVGQGRRDLFRWLKMLAWHAHCATQIPNHTYTTCRAGVEGKRDLKACQSSLWAHKPWRMHKSSTSQRSWHWMLKRSKKMHSAELGFHEPKNVKEQRSKPTKCMNHSGIKRCDAWFNHCWLAKLFTVYWTRKTAKPNNKWYQSIKTKEVDSARNAMALSFWKAV